MKVADLIAKLQQFPADAEFMTFKQSIERFEPGQSVVYNLDFHQVVCVAVPREKLREDVNRSDHLARTTTIL